MMRLRSCLSVLLLPLTSFAAESSSHASAAPRPNILLILADDMGYSDLGSFGGEIPTPNLDRLAQQGLRFTRAYNSARCCPSRAALLTGLYPHETGVGAMAGDIRPNAPVKPEPEIRPYAGSLNERCVTLAEVLQGAGYGTYMVGKWHVAGRGPIKRGFQEFYGFPNGYAQDMWDPNAYVRLPAGRKPEFTYAPGKFYATSAFTDYGLEFLRQARQEPKKPWFLFLSYGAAHFPLQAPRKDMERFLSTYRRGWDVLRAERFARMKKIGLADATWTLTDRSEVPVDDRAIANGYAGKPNPAWNSLSGAQREDLAHRMALFAAMVNLMDQSIGQILADLEKHGELDNTIVLFMSDNGACYEWGPLGFDEGSRRGVTKLHVGRELENMGGPGSYISYGSGWANLGNTPFRMYKHFTYEGGICSPLIVHWPAGLKGRTGWVTDPVHFIDIMPTFRELAGAEYPKRLHENDILPERGVSFVPALRGEPLPARTIGFEHERARALWSGPWKLVMSKRTASAPEWELYDLSKDRCETTNLAAKFPDVTKRLAAEWDAWARETHSFSKQDLNPGE